MRADAACLTTTSRLTEASITPRCTTYRLPDGSTGESRSSFLNPADIPDGATPYIRPDRYYPSHKAVDFYHHYKEDIALMAEMGCNVYRFSIGWSRIFPTGDEDSPNEAGLKFYDDVLTELEKYNMTPLITIHHDELPKYARVLFERFGKRCKYWLTFNEINAVREFVACGTHKCDNQTHYNAAHNMFIASALAVKMGHEMMPGSQFGAMYASSELYPATCKPEDVFRRLQARRETLYFIDIMARGYYPSYSADLLGRRGVTLTAKLPGDDEILREGTLDYVSFSYYRSNIISTETTNFNVLGGDLNPYLPKTDSELSTR